MCFYFCNMHSFIYETAFNKLFTGPWLVFLKFCNSIQKFLSFLFWFVFFGLLVCFFLWLVGCLFLLIIKVNNLHLLKYRYNICSKGHHLLHVSDTHWPMFLRFLGKISQISLKRPLGSSSSKLDTDLVFQRIWDMVCYSALLLSSSQKTSERWQWNYGGMRRWKFWGVLHLDNLLFNKIEN